MKGVTKMNAGKKFLITSEVAEKMNVTKGTVNNMAWRGVGPKYFKVFRRRLYDPDDVDAFIRQNPVLTIDQSG